ncbi:MAG: 2-C-methyl-D-erythritol 2,4-cyclodiphosphate synthase [Dehalococcoidia bacterium]|nr:2-C-methyl-D-erythritol 2,4-cyclodiphosphate synthase [Dehalococcoidia bacterium]
MFRVGIGFDAHPLSKDRKLIIGGVTVPNDTGLEGHSDGDVLIHSIIDAILGASNLGDKGSHFPSTDDAYKNISSLILLKKTADLLADADWRISNVDATILAQKPKLGPFIAEMREHIAGSLSVSPDKVSIKATTTDYMGFIGREEGIACCCIVSISR